jgi:hypothetical protein
MLRSSGWDAVSPTRARRSRSGRDVTSCRDHRRGAVVPTQEEQAARHICQSTARLSAVRVGSYTLERDAMRRDAARATRRVTRERQGAESGAWSRARHHHDTITSRLSRSKRTRARRAQTESRPTIQHPRKASRAGHPASQARHSAYATQMLALAAAPVGKAGCAPVSPAQHLAPPRPTRPDGPPPSAKQHLAPPPDRLGRTLHRPTDSARRSSRRRDLAPPPDRFGQTLHRGRRSTPRSTARPTRPDAPLRSGAGHSATIV